MKNYFIFNKEDNEIVGNPLGYKTYERAINDAYNLIGDKCQYYVSRNELSIKEKLYYDEFNIGAIKYKYNDSKWKKFIGDPYIKEHFNIIKREFKIVFTDNKNNN